jgi:hypothetical protein
MRDVILITLPFLSEFLFDASLEGGINTVPLYHGDDHLRSLA